MFVVLTALACSPATMAPGTPPDAPVLEGEEAATTSPFLQFIIKGTTPDGTLVRVHLDDACRGPVWRDLTAEQLREGQPIDLASGTTNVFTAMAVDSKGLASTCAAPVRVNYARPPPPQRPELRALPLLPTRETHFVIRGSAENSIAVRLFEGPGCSGTVFGTLSTDVFTQTGFEVDLLPNVVRIFSVDALNAAGQRSTCSNSLFLTSDRKPPFISPALQSPSPSPELKSFITLTPYGDDVARGAVFLGPGCTGEELATCLGLACTGFEVGFPPTPTSRWSTRAADSLGNETECLDAVEPWFFDATVPLPGVQLVAGFVLRGRVPASASAVLLYDGPDCVEVNRSPVLLQRQELVGQGVSLLNHLGPTDGGLVSVLASDGFSAYPCSGNVQRY